jgi:3-hydroxyisobutyrate dehydrogenase
MRVGIAGVGRMGEAIAGRLQETGHDIVVWNRTADKVKSLVTAGAIQAETPADLVGKVDAVITILFDAAAVERVYHGESGLLSVAVADKMFIEMSTVRPHFQEVLAQAVRDKGGVYVECPVGGTTGPARGGQLIGLAGGEAADVARAQPLLDQLCRRLEHAGPVGAGAAMKLAINLPLLVFWQAFGEANALVRHLGRDPAWLVDLFADSAGGPNVLKGRGPAIAKALAGENPGPVTFSVDAIRKDLRTMMEEAEARGFALPVVARALSVFDEAADEGWGLRDGAWLPAFWASHATPST